MAPRASAAVANFTNPKPLPRITSTRFTGPNSASAAATAAARLAPDDGAEEASFFLWAERGRMDREQRARYRPDACLRLAASLGFEHAVDELAAGT